MSEKKQTKEALNILLVDSDSALGLVFQKAIARQNTENGTFLKFFHGKNAKEALECVETTEIDIVIIEIVLPIISGYDVIKMLHEKNPHLTIISYTRLKRPQDLAKIAGLSVSNIFLKELITAEDLLRKITTERSTIKIDEAVFQLNDQIKALMESEARDVKKLVQCPKCHLIVPPDSHFCNNCGQKIDKETPKI